MFDVIEERVKRRNRITDTQRFRQIRQSGSSFSHPLLILCLLPNELTISRCGFTASRRVGNAVVRNRARRRMREVVRQIWDFVEPGWDLVWIARPAINGAEFGDLQAACARLLSRAGVLRTERSQGALPGAPEAAGSGATAGLQEDGL